MRRIWRFSAFQSLESHWTEGFIHLYLHLFTPGLAAKGPPALLAHPPGELVSNPGTFVFLPWGWHHCVGCTLSGRSCIFFFVLRYFWRHFKAALFVTPFWGEMVPFSVQSFHSALISFLFSLWGDKFREDSEWGLGLEFDIQPRASEERLKGQKLLDGEGWGAG